MTNYIETQDLIQGQKQHISETKTLFSTIKGKNGLNATQISHITKLKNYMNYMNFTVYDMAPYLGITAGQLVDILDELQPLTDEMQQTFYLYSGGFKFSTERLNEYARTMKRARLLKYKELWDKYLYAKRPIKLRKFLYLPNLNMNKEQIPLYLSLNKFTHPLAGLALKFYRAAHNETQYSIPEKLKQYYNESLSVCTRDFWHNVEIKGYISCKGNRALYLLTGFSLQQMVEVYQEMLQQEHIDSIENSIENIYIKCCK